MNPPEGTMEHTPRHGGNSRMVGTDTPQAVQATKVAERLNFGETGEFH